MLIGYARVSPLERHLDVQLHALGKAGCERVFTDKGIGGVAVNKPGMTAALECARVGDTFVIWRLDRLSRNLGHLIEIVGDLEARGLEFYSLSEGIETANAGALFYRHMRALADFELEAQKERTLARVVAARTPGRLGRPPTIGDDEWVEIKDLLASGSRVAATAALRGVSRQAIYYRLGQEVTDEQFSQFAEAVRLGADRAAVIARMGLFEPALIYKERRASGAKAA